MADQIIILKDGRVIENLNQEELEKSSLFQNLKEKFIGK